jgi:hypothetical protein
MPTDTLSQVRRAICISQDGSISVGSTVVGQVRCLPTTDEQACVWADAISENGVTVRLCAVNLDIVLNATEAQVDGQRVIVATLSQSQVPTHAPPPPVQPAAPQAAPPAAREPSRPGAPPNRGQTSGAHEPSRQQRGGSSGRVDHQAEIDRALQEEPPWWVYIPLAGLFWRPVRHGAAHALEQSVETLEQQLAVLVAGITIPLLCGAEIAITRGEFVSAVANKVAAVRELGQARTQEERWRILLRYSGGSLTRMVTSRFTGAAGNVPAFAGGGRAEALMWAT